MPFPYLSVIIPSYNEEENFKKGVLDEVSSYLNKQAFSWEVILVDDGSTDNTPKLLSAFAQNHFGFKLIKIVHGGKFMALSKGVEVAKGDVILFSDFDQSTPIWEFDKVKKEIQKGFNIVIGSRFKKGAKRINLPLFNQARSKVLNILVRIFLYRGIEDTQCGFKGGKREALEILFKNLKVTALTQPKGSFMGPWDIELLFLAKKLGHNVKEIPVTWRYSPSRRLALFSEGTKFLVDIFLIRYFDIMGKYKDDGKNIGK